MAFISSVIHPLVTTTVERSTCIQLQFQSRRRPPPSSLNNHLYSFHSTFRRSITLRLHKKIHNAWYMCKTTSNNNNNTTISDSEQSSLSSSSSSSSVTTTDDVNDNNKNITTTTTTTTTTSSSSTIMFSSEQEEQEEKNRSRNRTVLGIFYTSFVIYSIFFAPGEQFSYTTRALLTGDFQSVNQIIVAIFLLVGGCGINMAMILNAGSSRQRKWLPTNLFSLSSIAFGFISLGPYLIFRQYVPNVTRSEIENHNLLSRILESKSLAFITVLYHIFAYAWMFGLFFDGTETWHDLIFFSSLIDLTKTFFNDRFIHVSCIDFVTLSTLLWGPLTEDMKRRGWFTNNKFTESILTAFIILSTPALGPSLYALLRPPLPEKIVIEKDLSTSSEAND